MGGIGGVGILLALATYSGTFTTLMELEKGAATTLIPPQRLIEVLLLFLFGVSALTSAVGFLSVFLLSEENELIRASPLPRHTFFRAKFFELLGFSGWLVLVFGVPVSFAYGSFYECSLFYLPLSVVLFLLFLMIACGCGSLSMLFFSLLMPTHRARDLLLFSGLAILIAGYFFLRQEGSLPAEELALRDLKQLSQITTAPAAEWFPSTWMANALTENALSGNIALTSNVVKLLGTAALLFLLLSGILSRCYEYLSTKTHTSRGRTPLHRFPLGSLFRGFFLLLPAERRGFFLKEGRLFLRDVTQSIQLILLLTLCFIYLYNFQNFRALHSIPETSSIVWRGVFSLLNLLMGGFIVIAMSARFAYPAVSLEGQAWWILQSSPVVLRNYLREKLFFWWCLFLLPVTIVFLAGALALYLPLPLLIGHAILSLSFSYLIFAMGLCYGARFVTFSWEHPAQLTSNLGNFAFLIAAGFRLILLLVPCCIITALYLMSKLEIADGKPHFAIAALLFFGIFLFWNYRFANTYLDKAARLLEPSR
ncbi:hypothetical protein MRY87_00600 [bacterium]|nr:hypothetical protein [bacterium]